MSPLSYAVFALCIVVATLAYAIYSMAHTITSLTRIVVCLHEKRPVLRCDYSTYDYALTYCANNPFDADGEFP